MKIRNSGSTPQSVSTPVVSRPTKNSKKATGPLGTPVDKSSKALVRRFGIRRAPAQNGVNKSDDTSFAKLRPSTPPVSYKVRQEPPQTIDARIQLNIDAQLAAYPYHQSLDNIQNAASNKQAPDADFSRLGNWSNNNELGRTLATSGSFGFQEESGLIYDKKSGLTAYVMSNPDTQELRLIFGGTTSGKRAGGLNKRVAANAGFTLRQWIANAKNAVLGKTPDSYRQARELTDTLLSTVQGEGSAFKEFTVKVSGHSKGAGEATFAALARKQPVEAICFSSAQLGSGMQKEIPLSSKQNSANYVRHYNIKGDLVPKLGNVRNGLGHLGNVVTLPAKHAWNNPVNRHDQFAHHIDHFTNML